MSIRFNVEFSDKQRKSLDKMAEQLDTTKAGVIKTAMSLLAVAIEERRNGNSIGVIREGKVVKEIVGLYQT